MCTSGCRFTIHLGVEWATVIDVYNLNSMINYYIRQTIPSETYTVYITKHTIL